MKGDGMSLSGRPLKYGERLYQTTVRIPETIHKKILNLAGRHGHSYNDELNRILESVKDYIR